MMKNNFAAALVSTCALAQFGWVPPPMPADFNVYDEIQKQICSQLTEQSMLNLGWLVDTAVMIEDFTAEVKSSIQELKRNLQQKMQDFVDKVN